MPIVSGVSPCLFARVSQCRAAIDLFCKSASAVVRFLRPCLRASSTEVRIELPSASSPSGRNPSELQSAEAEMPGKEVGLDVRLGSAESSSDLTAQLDQHLEDF